MKNLAIIGVRLLAIWAFINSLIYLQNLAVVVGNPVGMSGISDVLSVTTPLIYLLVSAILFYKAPLIAEKMITGSEEGNAFRIDYEKLTGILFSTAGLLIFFWSLGFFINGLGRFLQYQVQNPQGSAGTTRQLMLMFTGGGIQLIAGLFLFLGGKKLAGWWYTFREWS